MPWSASAWASRASSAASSECAPAASSPSAPLTADEKTAPGQVTAQELQSTYRIDQVDAATKVYGVAGDPVSQSLSPAIMNAALRRENVNGVYLALHAKTLKDLLACIRDIPIHGLSITMPYKQSILSHLDNTDPYTAKIGACNTVVRSAGWKTLRLQHRHFRRSPSAGAAHHVDRRKDSGPRRRRRGARRSLRTERPRRADFHPEPQPRRRPETRSPGQSPHHQARRPQEARLRRHHQRHPRRHGQHQRLSAE